MNPLYHFYHIFAQGQWLKPVMEHIQALKDSGLLDKLDFFGIGIVGDPEYREEVKSWLKEQGIVVQIIAEEDRGWEQVTQEKIIALSPENAYVLYAHTKGSSCVTPLNDGWRETMTFFNVYRWEQCVKALDNGVDAAGIYWLDDPQFFLAGTFWWTKRSHLLKLVPLLYNSRWDAEAWIGTAPGLIADFYPGHPGQEQWYTIEIDRQNKDLGISDLIRFSSNGNIGPYRRGRIYESALTSYVQLLLKGNHITVLNNEAFPVTFIRTEGRP